MNVIYEKKPAMTFIGFHTEIKPNEGYQKCPEFWDREYNEKYAQLWQTMKPETPIEEAILANGIGMLAICSESERVCLLDRGVVSGRRSTGGLGAVLLPCKRVGGVYRKRPHAGIAANAEHPGLAGVVPDGREEASGKRYGDARSVFRGRSPFAGLRERHLGAAQ